MLLETIRRARPIVHCITNYVTVNDCANVLLAAGASPIMADEAAEVAEITALSKALLLNIGTLNQRTFAAMLLAGKSANQRNVPVILDPVGAGASHFRTESTLRLLQEIRVAAIKGNASELKALADHTANAGGIDAVPADAEAGEGSAERLARQHRCIILQSGAVDVVTDGTRTLRIANGDAMMSRITGSGCMLGALLAAFLTAAPAPLEGAAAAAAMMGIAGERAACRVRKTGQGTGTFRTALIDEISLMTDERIQNGVKYAL